MSSSVHVDNKNKDILILGEGPAQGLDDNTLTVEVIYPVKFTQPNERFVFRLTNMEATAFYTIMKATFVNATKIYQIKVKISETKDYALCLGNISKDFTIEKSKKQDSNNFFSFDFNPIDTNNILDINKYLMKGT